ncbi:MAG: insulinase family protein [Bdellovibrionales bacterium]|nr:insulinase family protein [Bdellovibrionales bacterium]
MKNILLICLLTFLSTAAFGASFLDSINREKWGDLDVVWIEDNKFPRFHAAIYFQDGSLSDPFAGLTQATFDQISSGTSKESQREIAEFFDFYGANLKHSVTHEYSVFSVQALTKDIAPVMGKMCELFNDAQYHQKELVSYVSRQKSQLKNLVTSHAALADRIFRQVSLVETPYSVPVEGTLATFDKYSPLALKERLEDLNKTKKTLYLSGPSDVHKMKEILANKCKWSANSSVKKLTLKKPVSQSAIYLVPVPGANQAQIRIGRYVIPEEIKGKNDHFGFLAGFLGGGFTSKLVQELRVKRGLTYSAGAYVSMQRDYGRAGIMTFSKSESAAEVISIVRDIFQDVSAKKFTIEEFKHQQGHQIGGFSFGFEETNAFLSQIMLYDHQERNLQELVNFPELIASLGPEALAQANLEAFPWERMTIVVVGDKSLEKSLSRIRPVRILNYKDYL